MHRFFTFPTHLLHEFLINLITLAELGLFYVKEDVGEFLSCKFCPFRIHPEDFPQYFANGPENARDIIIREQQKSNCKICHVNSRNVPMGNVTCGLNYKFEAHRLYSLLKKDDWQHVEPSALAKSGFYYTGDGDNVRCAFCNLEVRGWEEGDTPDREHTRWNPDCPFLLRDRNIINIAIGQEETDIKHDHISARINIGVNPFVPQEKQLEKYGPNIQLVNLSNSFLVTPRDLNIQDWSKPVNPNFATLTSRIGSFKRFWPKSLKQTPLEMAQAGFYHTGIADQAICFHCNLGLRDWVVDDDPLVQHCKWNSNCQYLIMCKGANYVEQVLHVMKTDEKTMSKRKSDGDIHCLKCGMNNVSKVNLPCGHMTLCNDCSADHFCRDCGGETIAQVKVPGFS
ncbi:baculoviral IAP repeat-containing protein 7-B-like [Cloeon dipterum]|uniref:baculoviral IAP repeat-containing protein 7-B-like n=1 Tax=Cloeon dipterum TaxID=197152 RepID=UPI00321F9989